MVAKSPYWPTLSDRFSPPRSCSSTDQDSQAVLSSSSPPPQPSPSSLPSTAVPAVAGIHLLPLVPTPRSPRSRSRPQLLPAVKGTLSVVVLAGFAQQVLLVGFFLLGLTLSSCFRFSFPTTLLMRLLGMTLTVTQAGLSWTSVLIL